MASGSEGDDIKEVEETKERPVRAVAIRGKKRGGAAASKIAARRSLRSAAPPAEPAEKEEDSADEKTNGVETENSEPEQAETVVAQAEKMETEVVKEAKVVAEGVTECGAMDIDATEVPELDDVAPPRAVVTTPVRSDVKLTTSISEDTADSQDNQEVIEEAEEKTEEKPKEVIDVPDNDADDESPKPRTKPSPKSGETAEEKPAEKKPAVKKPAEKKPAEEKSAEEKPAEKKPAEEKSAEEKPAEKKPAEEKSAEEKPAEEKPAEEKSAEEKPAEEKSAEEITVKKAAEGNTEPVSEDELPSESVKEPLDTETVSDDELPPSKPPVPEEIPDAEEVSEDELPPDKVNRNKAKATKTPSESPRNEETASPAEGETVSKKKKKSAKEGATESLKRKLPEGEYDPSSPTSENSSDETPAKKAATVEQVKAAKKEAKPKVLPELEKYWKAVKDDPADFTGWTYLLQYVDQENDVEAAREAYDAFLSHYPYCYGYWRKFADYERKKGNLDKCEEVFARGLKAIPLSVDLWLHYLNYCRTKENVDEDFLRSQYEKALEACGTEFRSDRLWEGYIKWETENKRLQNVTALYDRLLATPTQGYTTHFNNFQEHVSNNPPNKVLSVDEFLTLRQEVLQLLKQYDIPTPAPEDDSAPPGEELDVPPGEEAEQPKAVHSDEETTALRERIVSIRRKVHKQTVNAVSARWNYEEGIKRPYFHVKPLERCQLKNWKDYLDFEIGQDDPKRTIVLFERCLIACALYEEFWIRFVRYLQTLKGEDTTSKIRDVFERACTIHHPMKPSLHLYWSEFEESQKNYTKAAEILHNIERAVPGMLQLAYRRINLERRRGNLDRACELYEHYISAAKNRVIANNLAIKYARFCWKIKDDIEKASAVLRKALEKDRDCSRLYLQLVSMEMERQPIDEKAIVAVLDEYLERDIEPEQKLMFAQRKVEFLEDFGSDIARVQKAHEEFQRCLKTVKERKKKGSNELEYKSSGAEGPPPKKLKTSSTVSADSQKIDSSVQNPSTHTTAPPLPPTSGTPAAATSQYPPPNYSQNGGYSQTPNQSGYQSGQYATSQPPANYNQTYNQPYNQSGDYQNYQGWGYSQTGYSGYNQGWPGYYNY